MQGVILAAGLGTRLRPLTDERSKASVPVAGLPACAWVAAAMHRAGIERVAVNLHHLPDSVRRALDEDDGPGPSIVFSDESDGILGTGGGIRRAADLLDAREVIVHNGDVITDADLAGLAFRHAESGALATLLLVRVPDPERLGVVRVDGRGVITEIVGVRRPSAGDGGRETSAVFAGVHVLGPRAIGMLPREGCVVRETYFEMLRRDLPLAGVVHDGYWNDIGTPARYLECNLDVIAGRAGDLAVPRSVSGDNLVCEGARLDPGVRLEGGVVVGAGARVEAGARLARCVVWDGALAGGHLTDCIVGRESVVAAGEGS